MLTRRSFTGAMLAFGALARVSPACAAGEQTAGFGPLVTDPAGILDLPQGFSYRIIARAGDKMDDGFVVPGGFDGMGCFDMGDGRVGLVRNHELDPHHRKRGPGAPVDRCYDRHNDNDQALPGGTSTMLYNPATGRIEAQWLSLSGTIRNCAGGVMPWGSWLSCEEKLTRVGEEGAKADHGWVFEVPVAQRGLADPTPIHAMGRFLHEAATLDPRTGIIYMTEDDEDALFYRFLSAVPGDLHKGGRLQALALLDRPSADTGNCRTTDMAQGQWRGTRWIDLDGVENPHNDLNKRGHATGAARFVRAEGLHYGNGDFYFACTTGGKAKCGQIFRYRPSAREGQAGERDAPGRIQLFLESGGKADLYRGDNLAVAPWGDILLCEDNNDSGIANRLRGITPSGGLYSLGGLRTPAEPTGICFTPDARAMFLNLHSPGMTLAIDGPWPKIQRS